MFQVCQNNFTVDVNTLKLETVYYQQVVETEAEILANNVALNTTTHH
jgi:hypothetical protein